MQDSNLKANNYDGRNKALLICIILYINYRPGMIFFSCLDCKSSGSSSPVEYLNNHAANQNSCMINKNHDLIC